MRLFILKPACVLVVCAVAVTIASLCFLLCTMTVLPDI